MYISKNYYKYHSGQEIELCCHHGNLCQALHHNHSLAPLKKKKKNHFLDFGNNLFVLLYGLITQL